MKTLYRCNSCYRYTFNEETCPDCGDNVEYPYPARFSLVKERKYRYLIRKEHHDRVE